MTDSLTTTESGGSGCCLNGNETSGTSGERWVAGLRWTQVAMSLLGLAGNSLVVATLARRRYQSRFATAVFLHQTAVDLFVCAFTLVIILKPDQNPTENRTLGFLLCHVLNSQLFYWYSVFASVQNLLLIAVDRYWAVFRPVRYKTLGWRPAAACLGGLHVYSFLVNVIDVFSVEFDPGSNRCSSEITNAVWKRVFKVYGFIWFGLVYLAPVTGVVCLYAGIVCRLSGRGGLRSAAAAGRFRRRAATELTKSAVVITGIFIVCFSYDCVYYLLGHLDLVQYVYNSPTQLIGVFLVTLNSCANPVVYCIVMRSFRARILAAVCCCCSQASDGRVGHAGHHHRAVNGNRSSRRPAGGVAGGGGLVTDSGSLSLPEGGHRRCDEAHENCEEDDDIEIDDDYGCDEAEESGSGDGPLPLQPASLEPSPPLQHIEPAVPVSPSSLLSQSPASRRRLRGGFGIGFGLGFGFGSRSRLLEPPIAMKELRFRSKAPTPRR